MIGHLHTNTPGEPLGFSGGFVYAKYCAALFSVAWVSSGSSPLQAARFRAITRASSSVINLFHGRSLLFLFGEDQHTAAYTCSYSSQSDQQQSPPRHTVFICLLRLRLCHCRCRLCGCRLCGCRRLLGYCAFIRTGGTSAILKVMLHIGFDHLPCADRADAPVGMLIRSPAVGYLMSLRRNHQIIVRCHFFRGILSKNRSLQPEQV